MTSAEWAPAIGFLRLDISGPGADLHRAGIRRLANRWGYHLHEVVLADEDTEHPVDELIGVARLYLAEAVFVPTARHFDGCTIPDELVAVANVVTVADKRTYARQLSPSESEALPQRREGVK